MAEAEVGRQLSELPEVGDCGVQVDPGAVREYQLICGDDGCCREPPGVIVCSFPPLSGPPDWGGSDVRHWERRVLVLVVDRAGRCDTNGRVDGSFVPLFDHFLLAGVVVGGNWLRGRRILTGWLGVLCYFGVIGLVGWWRGFA